MTPLLMKVNVPDVRDGLCVYSVFQWSSTDWFYSNSVRRHLCHHYVVFTLKTIPCSSLLIYALHVFVIVNMHLSCSGWKLLAALFLFRWRSHSSAGPTGHGAALSAASRCTCVCVCTSFCCHPVTINWTDVNAVLNPTKCRSVKPHKATKVLLYRQMYSHNADKQDFILDESAMTPIIFFLLLWYILRDC